MNEKSIDPMLDTDVCIVCGKRGARPRILTPLATYCDACAERRYKAWKQTQK